MSMPPELYNDYPANLPLLSLEELQALHDYNEKLIKAEAQADLYLMTQAPGLFSSAIPSHTSPGVEQDAGMQWNSWHERDGEITRALCEDQRDKKTRWENLYERWNMAQRATDMACRANEEQSSNSLCLDPCLQNTGTTAIQHHKSQILAMNALLHLQEQESQSQQESSINNGTSEHAHVAQQQDQPSGSASPMFGLSIDQNLLPPDSAPNLPRIAESIDQSATPAPGRVTSLDTPMQYLQADVLPDETLEDHGAFRINLPSVSFLPQPSNGYNYPTIHFPSLSYVINRTANNLDRQYRDSMPGHNQSQSQDITPYPYCSTPVLPPPVGSNHTINPSLSSLTHRFEQTPSQAPKNIKKGTEPKKPHIPTRRWSRTHLNQLMRKHRPRNLPESIKLTDHVDVQDVPIQKLTSEYCTVQAERNGETILFGAGTRVEIPLEGGGVLVVPVSGGVLNSIEAKRIVKRTPFRLVVRDRLGNVVVDMSWRADVAVDDSLDTAS